MATFTVELAAHAPAARIAEGLLELVFEQLNIGDPQRNWAVPYWLVGHRSLSVGNLEVFGDAGLSCAPVCRQRLSAEQRRTALHT